MAKSKHRTSKRGTQKQRARTHEAWLQENHPAIYEARVRTEFLQAKYSTGMSALKPRIGEGIRLKDGTEYVVLTSGAWKKVNRFNLAPGYPHA